MAFRNQLVSLSADRRRHESVSERCFVFDSSADPPPERGGGGGCRVSGDKETLIVFQGSKFNRSRKIRTSYLTFLCWQLLGLMLTVRGSSNIWDATAAAFLAPVTATRKLGGFPEPLTADVGPPIHQHQEVAPELSSQLIFPVVPVVFL